VPGSLVVQPADAANGGRMETDMASDTGDLAAMDDPALITHWASVRSQLALTPKDDPRHAEVKAAYDAALAEYRRRVAVKAAT
jgi:hypothetical protein